MEGSSAASDTTSSPSLTSELFGSKDSLSSSARIFESIFPPPHKVLGRESIRTDLNLPMPEFSSDEACVDKNTPNSGFTYRSKEGEDKGMVNKATKWVYEEQRVQQPCHLSSSIYYGGQDNIFSLPQTNFDASASGIDPPAKNDSGEDDSERASRGNWWQGSLYY